MRFTMTSRSRMRCPSSRAHSTLSLTPPRTQYSIMALVFGPPAAK